MFLKTVKDAEVEGKRVLLSMNCDVPVCDVPTGDEGRIADTAKIKASLPTLEYLIKKKAKVIIVTHWDRPGGKVVEELRLDPIARELEKFLNHPIKKMNEAIGPAVRETVRQMQPGEIVMLENIRFYPGEEKNDPKFAEELAALAEIYVNNDFGTAHRFQASVAGVARFLPAYAGLLVSQEVAALEKAMREPVRPLATLMGGAKIETKIGLIEKLLEKVDVLMLGGALVANFYRRLGIPVGRSIYEPDMLDLVDDLMEKALNLRVDLILPSDVVVAPKLTAARPTRVVDLDRGQLKDDEMIVDVGPQTIATFTAKISEAKTIIWNGPVGAFEYDGFGKATADLAKVISDAKAFTIVGGGDTLAALHRYKINLKKFNHISTGGGAMLEFMEGKKLPGIQPLVKDNI